MSKRSEAAIERAEALLAAERAYEAEMDARIISESALIRAEWSAETERSRRVEKCGPVETRMFISTTRRIFLHGEEVGKNSAD